MKTVAIINKYLFSVVFFALIACQTDDQNKKTADEESLKSSGKPDVVTALNGTTLEHRELPESIRKLYQKKMLDALADYHKDPTNLEHIIWYGRRKAYLGYYWQAIKIFTEGIRLYPDSSQLYRHRGHRYITVRDFDQAIEDLETAAELSKEEDNFIEPDGLPNKTGIPLSNNKFNIYYHLGLAYYLKGDFYKALESYRQCLKYSNNDDLLTATSDWLYMTYNRLGMSAEAIALLDSIHPEMEIVENESYHKRLLMYKGEMSPEDLLNEETIKNEDSALSLVTQGYGVGNWYLQNGDTTKALEIYHSMINKNYWSAFGYIAAEADLLLLDTTNEEG
ncbi:tetratricopeptide repeat protein [Chondrinema litorale]|uniref:tetratricopeptide repeat protein n=1 Tax=Chondrinema litorale TaxID=2994555 RepID=UPI002543ACC6|nr:tetratricopeptide repeat protein [Chondrinema litorale]UZR93766.1 tetratricopeptide repeat protein [Chondrinema litorale]